MAKPRLIQQTLRRLSALLGDLAEDEPQDAAPRDAAPEREIDSDDAWKRLIEGSRMDVHETARPVLMCFKCSALAPVEREDTVVRETLLGKPPQCPKCSAAIDVWKNTRFALMRGDGLALATQVGAHHTSVLYRLGVGEISTFDLRDKGVPCDAMLLRIVHRAFPDKFTIADLDATDTARAPGFDVHVLGVRLGDNDATDMQAQTTVTWAIHDADDDGRRSLNRALMAVATGRPNEAIIPANVAVEVTLGRVLTEHMRAIGISEKRIDPFMTDAATYSHQVNVLLPLVLDGSGAPAMSDALRGTLNRLRGLRNAVGHTGKPKEPVTHEVVGECVAGAVFGFHYVRLAAEFLAASRASRS